MLNPASILVLTGYTGQYAGGWLAEESWHAYAQRHGYRFVCERNWPRFGRENPQWLKLRMWRWYLNACPQAWLFWADADSLVTNAAVKLEDFTDWERITVSQDWRPELDLYATGHVLLRSSPLVTGFLEEALAQVEYASAPNGIYFAMQATGIYGVVRVLPRRKLVSVPRIVQPETPDPWQPGDFVAHFTGLPPERRLALMRQGAENCPDSLAETANPVLKAGTGICGKTEIG